MSQSEDIKAIDGYIRRTVPATANADRIQNAWIQWFDGLGTLEMSFNSAILSEAKQRRDAFNAANILTANTAPNLSGTKTMASTTILMPGTRPTIREGSTGAAVAEWQRVIGVVDDGKFGALTKKSTISWQAARGLTADGIVGPMTWGKAIEESAVAAATSAGSSVQSVAQQTVNAISAAVGLPPPTPVQVEQIAHQAAAAATAAMPPPASAPAPRPAPRPTPAPVPAIPMAASAGVVSHIKGVIDRVNTATPLWAKIAGGALAGVGAIVGIRAAGKR